MPGLFPPKGFNDFAKKYKLDIIPVILPKNESPKNYKVRSNAYTGDGVLFNSFFVPKVILKAFSNP